MKPTTFIRTVFVIAALLIVSSQTFAAVVPKETINSIQSALKEQVKHPGFEVVQENTCCADVMFSINEKGDLIVKRIVSDNEAISEYLTSKLSEISVGKLKGPVNQVYRVKISFKLV